MRFYKFIALTFLFLTIGLLGLIVFMSSKRATIVIETKSSPVDVQATVQVDTSGERGNVRGTVVSTVVEKTRTFEPTGTLEEEGIATGTVTLHNEGSVAQPLVRTTRLLSPDGVLFRLESGVTVPANGTIEAAVYADQAGKASEIEPTRFTIPGLREAKQQVIYATSDAAMTGGVRTIGALSKDDIQKAEKLLLADLQELGEAELKDKNEGLTGVYSVMQHTFETEAEIGDEISSYELTGKATVVGVFYDAEQMLEIATAQLQKRAVDDTEVIETSREAPTVTVQEYDVEAGTATVDVFTSGVAYLNAESKQLQKSLFFGKNRDEVRRYVLKLDHVRGVDIKFSPAWMGTVPHIAEHVNVVVKNVE